MDTGAVDVSWSPCTWHELLGNQPKALVSFLPLGVWGFFSYSAVVPGGHCSVHGEGKGAVGAAQPWSGFSTSSHESLDVLGRSLTLGAVSSINLVQQEPGPALESCTPLGTQLCPFGLPSGLRVCTHRSRHLVFPEPSSTPARLFPAARGSPLCILPTPVAE